MICPHCQSAYTQKEGTRKRKSKTIQEHSCQTCFKWFYTPVLDNEKESIISEDIEPGFISEYKSTKPVTIHCATDIHHGAAEHDYKKFNEFIEEVDADANARWFMNGDNIELIPPGYKISQRGQCQEPDEQHITFIKRIEKIADKLLFVRGGNHDMIRSINILGFDVTKVMSDMLRVPYYKMPGYTRIKVKNKNWYLVSGHGKGGGKNGDLELEKMAGIYSDGDVFFLGHNHQLYAKPIDSLQVDGMKEKQRTRWFCRGGSFLDYAEYARYSFFPLARTGWVSLQFTDKNIQAWTN